MITAIIIHRKDGEVCKARDIGDGQLCTFLQPHRPNIIAARVVNGMDTDDHLEFQRMNGCGPIWEHPYNDVIRIDELTVEYRSQEKR